MSDVLRSVSLAVSEINRSRRGDIIRHDARRKNLVDYTINYECLLLYRMQYTNKIVDVQAQTEIV